MTRVDGTYDIRFEGDDTQTAFGNARTMSLSAAGSYQVGVEDAGGRHVGSFDSSGRTVTFDPRILEDTAGSLVVSARSQTTAEGTTVGMLHRSARVGWVPQHRRPAGVTRPVLYPTRRDRRLVPAHRWRLHHPPPGGRRVHDHDGVARHHGGVGARVGQHRPGPGAGRLAARGPGVRLRRRRIGRREQVDAAGPCVRLHRPSRPPAPSRPATCASPAPWAT